MNMLKLIRSLLALAVVGVLMTGCADDQEIAAADSAAVEQEVGCADVAGIWNVSHAQLSHTCMADLQTYHFAVEILQDGCEVQSVRPGRENLAGKVEGNVIRWDGFYVYPWTVNVQPHDQMVDGDSLDGQMIWNVTSNMEDAELCRGKTGSNATRVSADKGAGSVSAVAEQELDCVDVAGIWQHTHTEVSKTCGGGLQTFNFQAEILQDGCDVQRVYPGADIKQPVNGKVEGNVIRWQGFPIYPQTVSLMPHDWTVSGNSMSGEVLWRLNDSDGREICFGRSANNATRQAR